MRISLLVLLFLATVAAPCPAGATPAADVTPVPVLRERLSVEGGEVRLGDLFLNAGRHANVVVAEAPAAGARLVLDAKALYRLARTYGLEWRPASAQARAVVERQSVVVDPDELRRMIEDALAAKGLDPAQLSVQVASQRLEVPLNAVLAVEAIATQPGNPRFSAVVAAQVEGATVQRKNVNGRLAQAVEVPVLTRPLRPGEVITMADVGWARLGDGRIPPGVAIDPDELVGLAPKRTVRAGVPIRASDLGRPVQVAKGAIVTMVLRGPSMQLTARGRALEPGSDGQMIRVANLQSQTVVEAVVTGPGEVSVGTMPMDRDFSTHSGR
jgi:flagella basal body P-ring formation protein FlgA